jgi:1-aminocyclopropane-1-carboxylate deaminase
MYDLENKMVDLNSAITAEIRLNGSAEMQVGIDVLRLDRIHPVISGNKWFKLKYYLQEAVSKDQHTLLTFGGAYSNHILGLACAANGSGLSSIGVIRGEENENVSPTLDAAKAYGMKLHFITRADYKKKETDEVLRPLRDVFGDFYLVPEGGAGEAGIKGSETILQLVELSNYTHIIAAIGTGTMFTGIVNAALPTQEIIGIPVLKGITTTLDKITAQLSNPEMAARCRFFTSFHFGGYAKKNALLLHFMNRLYSETAIPTDFVYTGKVFYALNQLLEEHHFNAGSKVLVIHSGGLQGNRSLAAGTLLF